ncbi:MAG: DUF1295 domain-containing protein [Gammaproteobacteria bacterium]|nr:DUF1295 domain-containing protein [Gammaproteobacteria bacterium]
MMLKPLLINLIFAHTLMFGVWLIYKYQKIPMIADVFWSIGIAAQAFIYCFYAHCYPLLFILLLIWALRLSSFLYFTRFKKQHLDPRYQSIEQNSSQKPELFFLVNFQIQAFLQCLVASVWFFLCQTSIPLLLTCISALIIITGLCIEIHADRSLERFKQHGKGVCQLGLWRYSRHPNYFGELLIWFGFAIAASHFLGFISPLVLLLIMRFITAPLSEKLSLQHKGKLYAEYQKVTPMILPYKIFFAKF